MKIAAGLIRSLQLRYVFFDEEAEAEVDPERYDAQVLFGITLVPSNLPGLEEAKKRPDVVRVDSTDGVTVLYRRLDPVPHYQ